MAVTYGKIEYVDGAWSITLAPHVAMRFKRIFTQLPAGASSPFVMHDKPGLANDLLWFFDRYPVDISKTVESALKGKAKKHELSLADLDHIMDSAWSPAGDYSFREGYAAYRYQARAAEIARQTGRLLLMDDVGLGKTISSLAAVSEKQFLPAIIVVQPHLSRQWIDEYVKKFTKLSVMEIKTTKPEPLEPADLYVFRYSNISGWVDYFHQIPYRSVIFDEIQELRHGEDASKGRAARVLCNGAKMIMGLTATPIYNYGNEIYTIMNYVSPGCLGSPYEFYVEWCGGSRMVSDPVALGSYLRSEHLALRRTEDDEEVSLDLPPLTKQLVEVDWNDGDVESNEELRKQLALRVLRGSFTESGQAARELDLLLRQETGIAKARPSAAYARMIAETGEKVILAGWHRRVYEIWNEELSDFNTVMFTGSESQSKKNKAKEAFINGDAQIMFLSLRSGAGLDGLQRVCRHLVFGELDWSPQIHAQVTGRLRRYGQKRDVTAHYLHVDGGSDPLMIEMNGIKASQAHGIVDPFTAPRFFEREDSRIRALANQILGYDE